MSVADRFKNTAVLITGACGTIGAELTRQVSEAGAARIVCIDNNETELFFLQDTFKSNPNVECYLADVRDLESLKLRMQDIDIVLHSAALKHVGLCEESPNQAIHTNIQGTSNVIDAALANNVKRVIFTSSDKAVNPTNVMGTSKLMGERLFTAAAMSQRKSSTIFASTRFGNVLGSRGSVVPLFQKQIERGGPVTLTSPDMTRFVMTLQEAVSLVLESVWMAVGGEVFITKMPVARIEDIATVMVRRLAKDDKVSIDIIGQKPGEKMYEELMNDEEVRRTYELEKFFIVLSAFVEPTTDNYPLIANCSNPAHPYQSSIETDMTLEELDDYLVSSGILE